MLQSLVNIGEWKGRIVIFTNDRNHPLRAELPTDVASRVEEIILDFNDWSSGRQGKLGSCRFRFRAHEHLDVSGLEWVMYLDTDCIIRKPLEPLMEEVAATDGDLVSTNIKYFTMAKKKFFNGHLTGRYLEEGYKCCAIQGGIAFFKASMFTEMSRVWAEHDALPGRDGVPEKYVNDQSSQNLLWLRCHLGELPYKMPVISERHVINPRGGHRKQLGDTVVDDMTIWHFWGEKKRDQIRAAELELERLAALRADPLAFSRLPGLLGTWHHDKPAENLHHHAWTFHNNGLVTVAPIHLFGYWQARGARIVVTWERGWGSEVFDFTEGSSTLRGNTSGTGHSFTLTRQKELAAAPEGLIGIWQHDKITERISNQWEFKPDGSVHVHGKHAGLVGDWEAKPDGEVCVTWRDKRQRQEKFWLSENPWQPSIGRSWNNKEFALSRTSFVEPKADFHEPPLRSDRWLHYCTALEPEDSDVFLRQAKLWLTSLIDIGAWRGDIVLFTAQTRELGALAGRVTQIVIPCDFSTEDNWSLHWKRNAIIDFLVSANHSPTKYEGVFYCDTDCIAREPVERLLETLDGADYAYTRDPGPTCASNKVTGAYFQSPEQIAEADKFESINNGTFLISGKRMAEIFAIWQSYRSLPVRDGYFPSEQCAAAKFVVESSLGRLPFVCKPIPADCVAVPLNARARNLIGHEANYRASIWHFAGHKTQSVRLGLMEQEYRVRSFALRSTGLRYLLQYKRRWPSGFDIANMTFGLEQFADYCVPQRGLYVETGTLWGVSTEAIARMRPELNIITIDIKALPEARERLSGLPNVEIWEMDSRAAASRFADHSIDVLYLDALHDKDFVLSELNAWLPKVRPGGIIAGHDYCTGFGVMEAVPQFFGHGPERVFPDTTWIVRLPKAGFH